MMTLIWTIWWLCTIIKHFASVCEWMKNVATERNRVQRIGMYRSWMWLSEQYGLFWRGQFLHLWHFLFFLFFLFIFQQYRIETLPTWNTFKIWKCTWSGEEQGKWKKGNKAKPMAFLNLEIRLLSETMNVSIWLPNQMNCCSKLFD